MCTAVVTRWENTYFGRTLDLEYRYAEEVVVTPRHYPLLFRHTEGLSRHYAYLGMATFVRGVPLYYDGVNEMGGGIAGLRFADYAHYDPYEPWNGAKQLAVFELLPYLLSQATSVADCIALLRELTLVDTAFSEGYPAAPLHWLIADKETAITVEPLAKGLTLYENPFGVLSNAPDFGQQSQKYGEYSGLTPLYRSRGAEGLPGNWTSQARFIRGAYLNTHMVGGDHRTFFRLMDALSVPPGASLTEEGKVTETIYTSCCDLESGEYFYVTKEERAIRSVKLRMSRLDTDALRRERI